MTNAILLATTAALALILTVALTPPFRRLALAYGFVDRPNERSLHQGIVPRAGGTVLVAAALAGLAWAFRAWRGEPGVWAVLAGLGLVGGVGLWDDRWGLTPWTRLVVQFLTASIVVWGAGVTGLAAPAAVLWIVAVVNFYNFLDGIDGLAGGQGLVTGAGLALAGWDPFAAVCGAAVAGACAGFLVHNWAPARIFMGDVGSGTLGFLFASAPLLAPPATRARAVVFVAVSLWLFLADASWTVARRIARGERWHQAHREHLYQRLVRSGWSHGRVAALLVVGSAALTTTALAAWHTQELLWTAASLLLALVCFGAELWLVRRLR